MVKNKSIFKIIICLFVILVISLVSCSTTIALYSNKTNKQIETRVTKIMKKMTLKEKIAQMLFVYVPSKSSKQEQKKYQYGGYLMFADSFNNKTKKSVKNTIKGWQNVSKIKMLIGVDEEGGTVTRVSRYKAFRKSKFKSPRDVYKKGGYSAITKDTKEKSELLKSLGINTNFAPVADVTYKKSNYMYYRTFSTNYKSVSKFVKTSIKEYNKNNVVSIMKHFPGYGNNGNTHNKIITDKRSLKTFKKRDLLPFAEGIKQGSPMILVNHNIVKCFDKKNPASLSKKVHNYLRNTMKFKGVIITDGLDMKGIKNKIKNDGDVAVLAVQAGNDMLCTPYGKTSLNAIYKAVKKGKISKKQIDSSVKRILKMKLNYGIIK